jgi:acetyltransferase-like isoleucine patch superfamily enzyme
MDFSRFKKIGEDVFIDETARIVRPELVELGSHIGIDMGVYLSVSAKIGDYSHIAPHVCIIGGAESQVIMEEFTNIAAGSKLIVKTDDFNEGLINPIVPIEYRKVVGGEIIMKRHSLTGVNCTIMPGITMAEGSALGAGSVLTKDTEPWTIYVGIPARPLKMRNKELVLQLAKELGYL